MNNVLQTNTDNLNRFSFKTCHRIFLLVLAAVLLPSLPTRAVTFTVTPAAVSNTYTGVITLNVAGVTNGEQVIVQRYLDANSNSVVDAAEPLIDAFRISDGGVSTIGGVTNINVPFDSNSATDAITTTLSFALPIESTVAQSIFRLVSPTGNFAATSATFNVTNAALAQSLSGSVYANSTPLPNAIVVALLLPSQNFVGAAVTDNTGHYFLKVPPGTYVLLPTLLNYFTDQSMLPVVTLTNGMAATNNLFLTNGTVTISGRVYDAANSNTLGGVFLQLQSGNLFAISFTDTNGNYSAAVTPDNWDLKVEGNRLVRRAYMEPGGQQVNTSTGSVANVDFALRKANALFYGRIADASNAPLANIDFFAGDNFNQFKADGFSDANGNYAVAVLSTNNPWNCQPSSDNPALNGYIVTSGISTNISAGQAVLLNFTVQPATAQISGHLQDNLGNPVSGIGVGAYATIGGSSYNTAQVDTDGAGNYSFAAAAGVWNVYANCCGNNGLDSQNLYDPLMHTVNIPPTNVVLNITVYTIGVPFLSQPSKFSSTQFGFNLSGASGSNYTIQASTNLSSTNWFTVSVVSNLPGNLFFIQDNEATNKQRFYRALLGP
ncbi:MAG: carboxypeptidase regulatory-like domain-containing protein [Verrucomicrobia bacterium]|nr:carboxypeptidase regulatory-like domain-containing protein [Verrucomicrobiota bacterium]